MSIDGNAVIDAFFYILKAVPNTLFMAAVTLVGGIVLGALVAVIRIGHHRILNPILAVWVSFTRSVPAIVQIFIAYYTIPFLMAPVLSAFYGREIKFFDVSPYWTGYILFILFHAAFQSENIRGALLSVPRGQYEAAVAMGLSPFMAYRRIVFPQALTVVLPTFLPIIFTQSKEFHCYLPSKLWIFFRRPTCLLPCTAAGRSPILRMLLFIGAFALS